MKEVFVLTNVNEGMRVKLTRISKGLRQIDVASVAKVDSIDITRIEKGRYVLPTRKKRILEVLGLVDEPEAVSREG
jgi:transcriptional regulator with XRE-family HTH domain